MARGKRTPIERKERAAESREETELPPEALIPYGSNNKIHNAQQIDRLASSIQRFGFNQRVVVDEDNVILVGHGRVEAAKKLGLSRIPVLIIRGLPEADRRAYRILDNKLSQDSPWDVSNLELELGALSELGFPISDFGLNELEKLFGTVAEDSALEWSDLPGFTQDDATAHRTLKVHFASDADVAEFARLVGQSITEKTRSLWFPYVAPEKFIDKRWASNDGGDDNDEPRHEEE